MVAAGVGRLRVEGALAAGRSPRAEVLADLMRRQPLLAAINMTVAVFFALGLAGAVPASALGTWLGALALVQAARLMASRCLAEPTVGQPRLVAAAVVATSGASGFVWGLAGLEFANQGSPAQQILVPFVLAGMAAGAVTALPSYPPAFHAFILPALLPYAASLILAADPTATAMGATTLVYAAGIAMIGHQVGRSLRRTAALNRDNTELVTELEGARRELEQRVARRTAELETVMATVPVAVWLVHDPEGRHIMGSRHAAERLRLPPSANHSLTAPPEAKPQHFRLVKGGREASPDELPLQRAARGEVVRNEEFRIVFDDGTFYDELISAAPVRDAAGNVTGAVGAGIDITERKRMEEALRDSEQRFRDFAIAASDWFWETDARHRFTWMSANVEALAGVPREWHYGKTRLELMSPHMNPEVLEAHQRVLQSHQPFRDLEYLRRGPAGDTWLSSSGVPVFDAAGGFRGYRGVGRDITNKKRDEERIRHLAHHDELTGLPNRRLLQDRLRQAMALAQRDGTRLALLLLDLDHFKDINDGLGHPAGDRLLCAVGERLRASMRASDTLARLGGDEFAVIQAAAGADSAAALARKLVGVLATPFQLGAHKAQIGTSIGIALFPHDARDPDELVRHADVALYRAKQGGRGRFRFFEPAMDAEIRRRRDLEGELRQALQQDALVLHYQPQLELASGRIVGVEALVRWRHPARGLVPPAQFVPLAEATGLIVPLGAWVLDAACKQARAWHDAGRQLAVAVNVSPAQLRHEGTLRVLDDALTRHGLAARWLELEITEGMLMEHLEPATERTLRGLAARGVRLAIDDFGVGYSSLAYLKRLPFAKIKIDRSFVQDIGQDPEDEAVVRAVVALGHSLGKRVVAEGVETGAQLSFLRELGCDEAQGFLLARPAAVEAATLCSWPPERPLSREAF